MTRSFDVFVDRLNKGLSNNRDGSDMRRHRAHYDVTAMLIAHAPGMPGTFSPSHRFSDPDAIAMMLAGIVN